MGQQSLSQADVARIGTIASRADISVVAPQLVGAVTVKGRRALLLGVQPEQQFKLKRWWSVGSGHAPTNDHELIAGAAAAKTLGLTMGDYVRIGGRRFTVTGVLRETGSQDDSLLIVDLGAAQQVLREPGKVTLIEIAALYAGAPVEQDRRRDRRRPAAGQGHGHAGGGQEPPAGGRPVPPVQLCHRRVS